MICQPLQVLLEKDVAPHASWRTLITETMNIDFCMGNKMNVYIYIVSNSMSLLLKMENAPNIITQWPFWDFAVPFWRQPHNTSEPRVAHFLKGEKTKLAYVGVYFTGRKHLPSIHEIISLLVKSLEDARGRIHSFNHPVMKHG